MCKKKQNRRIKRIALLLIVCMQMITVFPQRMMADVVKYDALSRIIYMEDDNGVCVEYLYDNNGNITEIITKRSGQNDNGDTGKEDTDNGDTGKEDTDKEDTDKEDTGKENTDKENSDKENTDKEDTGKEDTDKEVTDKNVEEKDDTGKENSKQDNTDAEKGSEKGKKLISKTAKYTITSDGKNPAVTLTEALQKKRSTLKIPDTVTYGGRAYRVTGIGKKAFFKQTKLKRITLGKYITGIEAKAFYGCTNLRKITIRSKVLKKVGKSAFSNTHNKLVLKVPKSKLNAYKKLLKGKGQSAKANIKV